MGLTWLPLRLVALLAVLRISLLKKRRSPLPAVPPVALPTSPLKPPPPVAQLTSPLKPPPPVAQLTSPPKLPLPAVLPTSKIFSDQPVLRQLPLSERS